MIWIVSEKGQQANTLVDGFAKAASPYSSILTEQLGGHRDSPHDRAIMSMCCDARESEQHIRWADDLWLGIQPFSSGGVYVNYRGNEGEERTKTAYGVPAAGALSSANTTQAIGSVSARISTRQRSGVARA